jgi:RHS repeat-associated protein
MHQSQNNKCSRLWGRPTERVRAWYGGTTTQNCTSNPFGDALACTGGGSLTNPTPLHFTGKERDSESGLDNFGARYDSSSMGRFMSPDPIHMMKQKLTDPQQWNLYTYVRNNPLNLTDPTGLYLVSCPLGDAKCNKAANDFENQRKKDLRSKKRHVRERAAAWGDRGEDNGVNVTFKTAQEVHDAQGHLANGVVQLKKDANGQVHVNATFSESLHGSDLRRTIAHEGSHIEDEVRFLTSMDYSGKFNAAFNMTHYETEFKAYETGAEVKGYSNMGCGSQQCSFGAGPKGYATLDRFLNTNPAYAYNADQLLFDPADYPQH